MFVSNMGGPGSFSAEVQCWGQTSETSDGGVGDRPRKPAGVSVRGAITERRKGNGWREEKGFQFWFWLGDFFVLMQEDSLAPFKEESY